MGGEKKPVGVIVEIEQVEPDSSFGAIANEVHQPKEKDERKKVRLCRDCLNVVLSVFCFLSFLFSLLTLRPPSTDVSKKKLYLQ